MTRVPGSTGHLADHDRWDQFITDVTTHAIYPGPQGVQGVQGIQGPQGNEAETSVPFNRTGLLTVGAGVQGYPVPFNCTILGVRGYIATAPTGADVIFDVNKNGTTIFGTQSLRPTCFAGSQSVNETTGMTVTSLVAGDILTVDVDQIGSTIAGSNVTIVIRIRKV